MSPTGTCLAFVEDQRSEAAPLEKWQVEEGWSGH